MSAPDVVIGLEVHVQLATESKIFCPCSTAFGAEPNTQICPVCSGLPGSLPVLNRRAFELGVRAATALGAEINRRVKFDRKNYFYPDLPKGYQISQYDEPVGRGGSVEIATPAGTRAIRLTRLHLEEDAGKLIHDADKGASFVDLNRAGLPLVEIVSEPEIKSPEEAHAYLTALKAVLKCIGVSEVNMEKGHLRCDANVSVRKTSADPFGAKVEIKNLNSFRFVRDALHYEIKRQAELLGTGARIAMETRLWDPETGRTASMRSKEEAHDYRYFPEPDLVPFEIESKWVDEVRKELPPLPKEKRELFKQKYGLNDYDSDILLQDDALTAFFEACAAQYKGFKNLANWITGPLFAYRNEHRVEEAPDAHFYSQFVELLKLADEGVISLKVCREDIFPEFMKTGKSPREIVSQKGLSQISDTGLLEATSSGVIQKNAKSAADYRAGKKEALQFLVGQVMKETKGKANPNIVSEIMRKMLENG